jgi:DNA-binding protein H-NS
VQEIRDRLDYMDDLIRELRDMARQANWGLLSSALELAHLAAERQRTALQKQSSAVG